MITFRQDVFAWIPQPEIPNPIHTLEAGSKILGPGGCGPYFGGDNFVIPTSNRHAWAARTYRAMQTFEFGVRSFGDPPLVRDSTGVRPGTTTVLTGKRSEGGRICYSHVATVKASSGQVKWVPSDHWYEVNLHGAAQDPVPTIVGQRALGSFGATLASAATPNLEWDLTIRFQSGTGIPAWTRVQYAKSSATSLDVSKKTFPFPANFGGANNLVHGTITVRRFPSYVVYVTISNDAAAPISIPVYFADASGRNPWGMGALAEILVAHTDVLRPLTW